MRFDNPQALNRYSYTLNNPIRYIDPSGHGNCESEDGNDCGQGNSDAPPPPADPAVGNGNECGSNCVDKYGEPPEIPTDDYCNSHPNLERCGGDKTSTNTTECPEGQTCIGQYTPPPKPQNNPGTRPDGVLGTITFMYGIGPYYWLLGGDLVYSFDTNQAWLFSTTADPNYQCVGGILCRGDLVTPQASVSMEGGLLWNLNSPMDYYGSFHDQNGSIGILKVIGGAVDYIRSSNDRTWGVLAGPTFGPPQIPASYADIHIYSTPRWQVWPLPPSPIP